MHVRHLPEPELVASRPAACEKKVLRMQCDSPRSTNGTPNGSVISFGDSKFERGEKMISHLRTKIKSIHQNLAANVPRKYSPIDPACLAQWLDIADRDAREQVRS